MEGNTIYLIREREKVVDYKLTLCYIVGSPMVVRKRLGPEIGQRERVTSLNSPLGITTILYKVVVDEGTTHHVKIKALRQLCGE